MIKNAIKIAVTAIVSLHMVCQENPENQNSKIAANANEAGTWIKLFFEFASSEQCYGNVYRSISIKLGSHGAN